MCLDEILKKYDMENLDKLFVISYVINEFSLYYGMNFSEMREYFTNYEVITFEDISNYLAKEKKSFELSEIIDNRKKEYSYYKDVLKILSDKALNFLDLLEYLSVSNVCNKDDIYEKQLEDLKIYHCSSVLMGDDIKRILLVLFNIKKKFDDILENINNKEKYLNERIDDFGFIYGDEDIYPSKNLIIYEGKIDKTSLSPKKKLLTR